MMPILEMKAQRSVAILGLLVAGHLLATAQTVSSTNTPLHASATQQPRGIAITLEEAIQRSQAADTSYASAVADSKVAQAQAGVARSALLPGVVYHNQYLYTQPSHLKTNTIVPSSSNPVFIANNAVHEYTSQGIATENIGLGGIADLRKANAEAAAARARLEVARRGLVSSVVTSYYAVLVAREKAEIQRRALDEAEHFAKLSSQLEAGGEVAHADTIKSNLEVQQRVRDLGNADLAAERARIDLAVLLFPDPMTQYTLAGDLHQIPGLPVRDQINIAANVNNPDLRAALASFRAASLELSSSRFDYLPSLSLNYSYGIDSDQFAVNNSDGSRNLGYSAYATLDIPVWDWFATRDRVRQSSARRDLARIELTSTQRRLLASIEELYREAQVAHDQIASLDNSIRDATEALRLTDLRYTNGEAPILEVIDAQNTVIAVQNNRADGAARYSTALADLQTLTGKLP